MGEVPLQAYFLNEETGEWEPLPTSEHRPLDFVTLDPEPRAPDPEPQTIGVLSGRGDGRVGGSPDDAGRAGHPHGRDQPLLLGPSNPTHQRARLGTTFGGKRNGLRTCLSQTFGRAGTDLGREGLS